MGAKRTRPECEETDRLRKRSADYYEKTKESRKAARNDASRKYYHETLKNRPGFMEAQAKTTRESHRRARLRCLDYLGGKCCKCGFDDYRALQIDHVNGGGVKELNSMRYWAYMTKVMTTVPGEQYQLLCANCNWIKRDENSETPGRPKLTVPC